MTSLASQLKQVYEGTPWYGKNVVKSLGEVAVGKALLRLGDSYNIAELVHHILAWRQYVLRLLTQGKHTSVPDSENFPTIDRMSMEEWQDLLARLDESQEALLLALTETSMDPSQQIDEKSSFTVEQVVQGAIHHDIYHVAQINLLSKYL